MPFQFDDDFLDSEFGSGTVGESQNVADERGLIGDIGSHLYRGGLNLLETGAKAAEAVGLENPVDEWVTSHRQTSKWAAPDMSEYLGDEGLGKRSFGGMLEALPASVAPAAIGGATGAAIGSAVPIIGTFIGGAVGATLGTFGFFGLGEGRKAYEEGLSKGLSEEDAKWYGIKKGGAEGGLESLAILGDILFAGSGRIAKGALIARKAGKAVSTNDLLKLTPKKLGGDLAKIWATENITEQTQLELAAKIDKQYDLGGEVTWEERVETVAVTTWMSLLFGGLGAGANITDRARLKKQLESDDPVIRHNAGKVLHDRLKDKDPELAKAFKQVWADSMVTNKPIQLDAGIIEKARAIPFEKAEAAYDAYDPETPKPGLVERRKKESVYDKAKAAAKMMTTTKVEQSAPVVDDILEEAGIPVGDSTDAAREEAQLERLREKAGEFGEAITAAHRGEPVEEQPLERPRAANDPKLAANLALMEEAKAKAKAEREAPIRGAVGVQATPLEPTGAEAMEARAARQTEEAQLRGQAPGRQMQPEMVQPESALAGPEQAPVTPADPLEQIVIKQEVMVEETGEVMEVEMSAKDAIAESEGKIEQWYTMMECLNS